MTANQRKITEQQNNKTILHFIWLFHEFIWQAKQTQLQNNFLNTYPPFEQNIHKMLKLETDFGRLPYFEENPKTIVEPKDS